MPEAPSPGGEPAAPTTGPEPGQPQAGEPTAAKPTLETAEPLEGQDHDLPGVLVRAKDPEDAELDDFMKSELQLEPDEQPPEEKDAKGKGKERARGPDGRFLGAEGQPEGGQPAPVPGSENEPGAETGYEFAGERWDSQEKAEQSFRTLRGMHKSLEGRAGENWQAYTAWKDYAEREIASRDARIAELSKGGQISSGAGQETGVVPGDVKSVVDWDAYRYIIEKGSPEQAGQYMIDQIMEHVNKTILPGKIEGLRAEMNQKLAPITEQTYREQTANTMTEVTTQMQAYKLPDGRDAFPELKNAEEVEKIGYFWAKEAKDQKDAQSRLQMLTTQAGLMQAVALYRMIKSMEPAAPAASPAPGLPTEPVAPGAAATVSAGGRDGFTPGPPNGMDGNEAAMVAELDKGAMVDNDLGFARNLSARRR